MIKGRWREGEEEVGREELDGMERKPKVGLSKSLCSQLRKEGKSDFKMVSVFVQRPRNIKQFKGRTVNKSSL